MTVLVLDDGDTSNRPCETHTVEVVIAFNLVGERLAAQVVNAR
jgi:hypothetical protein